MENFTCLNRVNLRGTVGTVRLTKLQGADLLRFTVATDYIYKGLSGQTVLETTWSVCVAFCGKDKYVDGTLSQGDKVEVEGRLRNNRYTGEDGVERSSTEIVVSKINRLNAEPHIYEAVVTK